MKECEKLEEYRRICETGMVDIQFFRTFLFDKWLKKFRLFLQLKHTWTALITQLFFCKEYMKTESCEILTMILSCFLFRMLYNFLYQNFHLKSLAVVVDCQYQHTTGFWEIPTPFPLSQPKDQSMSISYFGPIFNLYVLLISSL